MPFPLPPTAPRHPRGLLIVAAATATAVLLPTSSALAATPLASIVSGTASGRAVPLSSGTYTFADFGSSGIGVDLQGKAGLTGASVSSTVVQMNARSSTKASTVPTAAGTSNKLYLMAAYGTPTLRNFTLQGTSQGHDYNGLKLSGTSNAVITNVKVAAIPGSGYNPPQETFAINDQRSSGSKYSNVTVDGAGVGASGLAANSSTNLSITDSTFANMQYSAGVALWQTTNATLTNVTTKNNRTGLNFERCSGTITITKPTILNESNQDLYIGSDQGRVKVVITDPVYSGHLRIRVPATYRGGPNTVLKSDVRVLVNGVDKTSSVVTWI